MANRLKMTCFKRTVTAEAGGPSHSETILSDNENLLNLSGFNALSFEPGKEYYVDFCKVIAPRQSKYGTPPEAGAKRFYDNIDGAEVIRTAEGEETATSMTWEQYKERS